MIDFNIPPHTGAEEQYIQEAIEKRKLCGDGMFTRRCSQWMEQTLTVRHALLTTSCTHALEMAAVLTNIGADDEVIMPSYTFVSTANAFVQRGARIVFTDIRPDTMNLDERLVEDAVTPRTRVILPVHYAGVSCDMDPILDIAHRHHLQVVEDAAQGIFSYYKDKALGGMGDYGCLSFHETKNLTMGEGGALLFQKDQSLETAEIIREKGTNRSQFFRGQIDKYTWVDYGSSYLPSELNAAYLWGQFTMFREIQNDRMETWKFYHQAFQELEQAGYLTRPVIPSYARHNAHMYYLKLKDLDTRTRFIAYLKERGVMAVFHYVPLHSSPAGQKFGRFHGEDKYTTRESERLVRLPLFYGMGQNNREKVVQTVKDFFRT
ncbi:MAG: dTDP-4-amino-4,6-dideoxygalactose transaminase [Lachnospiraceae bacterium]|nr:dTDP-4-amino-4,6-dideoxygalactose transaminase [Lachnospiraceae bacterium]